jgi:preprotein translocase subunit SecG
VAIVDLRYVFVIAHAVICLSLISTVLLQSGRSAGLSGTIAGGAQTLFGKKKGMDDTLEKITTVLAVLFMVVAVVLTILSS